MLKKLMSRLVGFQQENIEAIDWGRIWQQLKWMNRFSRGYRGRISFLTGLSLFFSLFGIAYALIYRQVIDQIMPNITDIIQMIDAKALELRQLNLFGKFMSIYNMLAIPTILPISIPMLGVDHIVIDLTTIVFVYLAYKLISYAYSLFMQFFNIHLQMDLGLGIKRKVYSTILESDWLSLTQYHAGDLVQRVSSDADTVSGFAMSTVPSLIVQAVTFVVALGVMIHLDWTLLIVAFIGVPLYLFNIWLKGRRTRYYSKRSLELNAKNSSFLYESMANIMVIKSFMLVPQFIGRYRGIHQEVYDLTIERTKYGIVTGAITGAIGRVISTAGFLYLLLRLIDGHTSFGTLMSYSMISPMVITPVTTVIGFIMSSIEISASAERVMTLYELPRDRTQIPEAVSDFAEKAEKNGLGLQVDDLAFAYVANEIVLHDVNITVNPGETVAFVGPSGEGKTTLIRLVLGLLTPNLGKAYLKTGKNEILDLSVETREFFSYVPQGNTMFSGTIRENMEMGNPNADEAMIIRALEQACLWNFISSLPQGLDTKIGERGIGVSEGQAQRLAIARALLRNAPILLLDEATSALDIYTEKEVLDNIFASGVCKTCILTTHRPSVFTVCDKIYRVRQRSVELIKETRDQEVAF